MAVGPNSSTIVPELAKDRLWVDAAYGMAGAVCSCARPGTEP